MRESVRHRVAPLDELTVRIVIAIWTAALLLTGTAAQAADEPSTRIRLVDHVRLNVRLIELYQSRSEFDGADLVRHNTIMRPTIRIPYAEWGEIELSTRYDIRHYDFDGRSDLVDDEDSPGTPFKSLNHYRVRLGTNIRLSKRLFWSTGGFLRAKWERGADLGDATRFGSFMAIGLQPDPRILLGIGAGMQKKLHGGQARFGPIWRVHWQIQDRVDLLVANFTGRIRVDLDRQFQLQLIARYEERKYRLRERGGDQASRLKDRRIPVRLRLVWRKSDRTRIDFDIGANFEQRLRTNAGDSNQSIEQGTTIFFGVGVRFRN